MIYYFKLFDMLNRRGMKKTDLLKIISSPTLAKLSKGEVVKTDIIDRICLFMNCQPGDIMECVTDYTKPDEYGNINYTKKVADREHDDYEEIEMIAKDPYHRDD
ncbi:helix-turn-helix transcriptional regulator [Blautia intestinalis]|uniref:helix-turn-helix domain-containing protein n=1 Tax=Blautia intestinalis TaxID=2763028 RepID=UPI002ED0A3FD